MTTAVDVFEAGRPMGARFNGTDREGRRQRGKEVDRPRKSRSFRKEGARRATSKPMVGGTVSHRELALRPHNIAGPLLFVGARSERKGRVHVMVALLAWGHRDGRVGAKRGKRQPRTAGFSWVDLRTHI